ncbi:MAG: hypothetical protein ACJAYC_002474 [Halieaceae bacterium]
MNTARGEDLQHRMKWYQATALFSIFFAVVGFSYNVWRMEITEHNSNVREASFETLLQLAELEQLVFAAHYDQDPVAGNPRNGWVKVGLIADLSVSCSSPVNIAAETLRGVWSSSWRKLPTDRMAAEGIVVAIDHVRSEVLEGLTMLD